MSLWAELEDRSSGDVIRKEDLKDFMDMLKSGIVHFTYQKKDIYKKGKLFKEGEFRDAWGTKNLGIATEAPNGGVCHPKEVGYTTYFDMEKGKWRVFWEDRVINFDKKIYTEEEFMKNIYPTLKDKK